MNICTGRLFAGSALSAMLVALASPSYAQTAAPAADTTAASGQSADESAQEVVVTGTIFRRTNTETPSPVTVLTADNLAKAGLTTVNEAIRSISADSAGSIGTGFQTGFSAGGSAVSLRGLGVSSTLVLIDGLRSTNFPINDDGHNAYVDLNSIPFSMIERVEVLKDGASSTYGADAIGGVVNLIMKKQFTGIAGAVEGGVSQRGDAGRERANLTVGYGDYETQGFNAYLNAEYEHDGRVSNHSRGYPFNTLDLTPSGGIDNNTADGGSLAVNTPTAYVARVHQNDLNNPLSGAAGTPLSGSQYLALGLQNCQRGTFTVTTGGSQGTGCKYDLTDMYRQLQPLQERYSLNGHLSFRLADNVEGLITASYSRDYVNITTNFPSAIRNTQPFGGAPALASSNPGIVLPVYICAAGTNCATAADRKLNPNNPYAAAYANDPANGAARIYYLFGDIPLISERENKVYRVTAGLHGTFEGDWEWRVNGVYARDNLKLTQHGYLNIANLLKAVNTGSYNFVNPTANSQEVRDFISPDKITPSHSQMMSLDASITKKLMTLPGGDLQVAVGGQVRREELENNNQNAALDTYSLTTSSAFGKHTVSAGYFEIDAPVLKSLEINASGRYDHYSEGFSHFSPKIGAKFTPIKEIAFRGTFSKGFRAPTFAESGARSQYAGFVSTTPPCSFILAHGGTGTTSACSANGNPYNNSYSLGRGYAGNPNLQPEKSRSYTLGTVVQPLHWLSLTGDYYNVKKSNLIVGGPSTGAAVNAYYSQTNLAAAMAAVAAVGPGYSVNVADSPDPLFPNALPRLLILNVPWVNANYALTSGFDISATANLRISDDVKFTSRAEVTHVIKYDLHTASGVQHYAGNLGPYDLSSGNGTPSWRGNWQNTLQVGGLSVTATTYYVSRIKAVSQDQGSPLDCDNGNLYSKSTPYDQKFCYIKRFIYTDLNVSYDINDKFGVWFNILNVTDAKAPLAAAAYTSAPNYLTSWHSAGAIGRQFRAGARFKF